MSSPTPSFPPIPFELLKALDAKFPLRSPTIETADRQVWIEAGWRAVIGYLQMEFKRQNDSIPQVLRAPR